MKITKTLLVVTLTCGLLYGGDAQAALKFTDYYQGVPITGAAVDGTSGAWDSTSATGVAGASLFTNAGFENVSVGTPPSATGAQSGSATVNIENLTQTWWKGETPAPINGFTAIDFTGTFEKKSFSNSLTLLVQWGASSFTRFLAGSDAPSPVNPISSTTFTERLYFAADYSDFTTGIAPLMITISGDGFINGELRNVTLTSNPEPASIGLLSGVFAAFGGVFFRRRRTLTDAAA